MSTKPSQWWPRSVSVFLPFENSNDDKWQINASKWTASPRLNKSVLYLYKILSACLNLPFVGKHRQRTVVLDHRSLGRFANWACAACDGVLIEALCGARSRSGFSCRHLPRLVFWIGWKPPASVWPCSKYPEKTIWCEQAGTTARNVNPRAKHHDNTLCRRGAPRRLGAFSYYKILDVQVLVHFRAGMGDYPVSARIFIRRRVHMEAETFLFHQVSLMYLHILLLLDLDNAVVMIILCLCLISPLLSGVNK